VFAQYFREAGQKCWLIRTDNEPHATLAAYLDSTQLADRDTATCRERPLWWRLWMPPKPDMLMSQSFRGRFPKIVDNQLGAIAVGGVCGLYNLSPAHKAHLAEEALIADLSQRVVAHSNGLHKIEINQMNTLLKELFADPARLG